MSQLYNTVGRTVPNKQFGHQPQVENIPMSFGANFHDDPLTRSSLRKSHTLQLNPRVDHAPHTAYDFSGGFNADLRSSWAYGGGVGNGLLASERLGSAGSDAGASAANAPPVLRFLGYSVERVPESPDERTRVRKLALVFHTADQTLLLREASQVNAGMAQGTLLGRQRVPKDGRAEPPPQLPHSNGQSSDGSNPADFIGVDDLRIGGSVSVFGRVVHLVDCAEATRAYLRDRLGRTDVPDAALPWPTELDTYNTRVACKLAANPRRMIPTAAMDHKRALESASGGAVTKHAPEEIRTAQQFLANDINKHLQFAALWDDRARMSGDLRHAVVRYYLENDTIEIVERREENCGREGAAKLLSRQRVQHPDRPEDVSAQQNTYGRLLKRHYYTADDLAQLGNTLRVNNRDYLVYDADAFTRAWFLREKGVDLGAARDVSEILLRGSKQPPLHYPPPHDGFGTEEDSLQNWKHLLLKPVKTDQGKLVREAGKVMLYAATLDETYHREPEDQGRKFLILFHRATDELEVQERQLRNTGIVGGKLLAKSRHLKTLPDGRRVPYAPQDFVVGGTLFLAGHKFKLLEIDQRSQRQLDGEVPPVTEERVRELIVLFKTLLQQKYLRLQEGYRRVAPEGVLTAREIIGFFSNSTAQITQEEAEHVVFYFAPDGNGCIGFDRFAVLMGIPNSQDLDVMSVHPRSIKGIDVSAANAALPALGAKARDAETRVLTARLRRQLVAKLSQRRGMVQEVFRLMGGHATNARLTPVAFREACVEQLHMPLPPREEALLLAEVFAGREATGMTIADFMVMMEETV